MNSFDANASMVFEPLENHNETGVLSRYDSGHVDAQDSFRVATAIPVQTRIGVQAIAVWRAGEGDSVVLPIRLLFVWDR
jgi:hypothetical protein